jgi:small-conductance mechanosensitive channel
MLSSVLRTRCGILEEEVDMLSEQVIQALLEALREDERTLRDQYMVVRGRILQLEALLDMLKEQEKEDAPEIQPSGSALEQTAQHG